MAVSGLRAAIALFASTAVAVSLLLVGATERSSAATPLPPTIVGGNPAPVDSWPSIAALASRSGSPSDAAFCGGTLIHPKWVVTAAHCLEGEKARKIRVFVGRTNLDDTTQGEVFYAKKLVRHRWNPNTDRHDIAMVKLRGTSTQPVMPMVSRWDKAPYRAGTVADIAGWGATTPKGRGIPDTLQQAQVQMVASKICRKQWWPLWPKSQVCAGIWPQGGIDSCSGDSGGPLTVADAAGQRVLAGLTSFGGNRCAARKDPAVYTKLSHYQGWIKRVIRYR